MARNWIPEWFHWKTQKAIRTTQTVHVIDTIIIITRYFRLPGMKWAFRFPIALKK